MKLLSFAMGTMLLAAAVPGCWAAENDCQNPATPSTYHPQPGDRADANSLDASLSLAGASGMTINMCVGELRVKGTQGSSIRLEVTAEGVSRDLSQYLHDFSVQGGSAKIDIRIPKGNHPVVTVYVPTAQHLRSEINLGAGNLNFYANRIAGQRLLNLGAGDATIYLDADHDYASLEANIGMGSFHDKRPGGHNAHFVIARSMAGTGSGDLQVNVGAGEVDLEPAH